MVENPLSWLPSISHNPEIVCSQVASHWSPLKILLKTKDDPFLLSKWIEHHSAIVGYENLYVFDNGSTSLEVAATYRHYADRINVFSFSGFYDVVHKIELFPELYRALQSSSRFFTFLDTDEFLIWLDERTVVFGPKVLERLSDVTDQLVVPGVWLSALRESEDLFWLNRHWLGAGLQWGKPIISAECALSGFINHNGQLNPEFFANLRVANCFVLHHSLLFPQQRIATNLNKLIAANVLPKDDALHVALSITLDSSSLSETTKQWLAEIQSLSQDDHAELAATGDLPKDVMQISQSGDIRFHDFEQERLLRNFLLRPRDFASWLS